MALLDELYEMAVVKPHVVQNFAQPGDVDKGVRDWCRQHSVLFQPYASIRNIDALPEDVHASLQRIAENYNVSPQSVAIRFFLQVSKRGGGKERGNVSVREDGKEGGVSRYVCFYVPLNQSNLSITPTITLTEWSCRDPSIKPGETPPRKHGNLLLLSEVVNRA